MIRPFALTYPQLMQQAQAQGLPAAELARLHRAYDALERLSDGFHRAQGMPFICHLVRTASIVLAERQPVEVVIAAMGLVDSWWGLLALPAAFLIGFGFAGAGIAAVTWMRTWQDFDIVQLVMLPMLMFSAVFFPISVLPDAIEWVVQALPLYHGVSLVRALTTGVVGPAQLLDVAYLAVMGLIGMAIAARRIDGLLLK